MAKTKNKGKEEVVEETVEVAEAEETTEAEVETVDAAVDVTQVGIYKGEAVVRTFNVVTHGEDFREIAEAQAEKIGGEVRDYVDPTVAAIEKTAVKIVNQNGNLVRVFALSTHGKDYAELADAFITKHGESKGLKIG